MHHKQNVIRRKELVSVACIQGQLAFVDANQRRETKSQTRQNFRSDSVLARKPQIKRMMTGGQWRQWRGALAATEETIIHRDGCLWLVILGTSRGFAVDWLSLKWFLVGLGRPAGAGQFRNPVFGCLAQKFLDTPVIWSRLRESF